MHLEKFINTNTGKILMSIILGIGLATFFRVACKGSQCRIIEAPPMEDLVDKIYRFDESCYKIQQNAVKCDKTKTIVSFSQNA